MKSKKSMKRYCKTCKKHTDHKVAQAKQSTRGSAHPLSRGSDNRMRRRGLRRGLGNLNKYSRPAISKFKRTGAKQSKKIVYKLTCDICKKSSQLMVGRAKKIEFE